MKSYPPAPFMAEPTQFDSILPQFGITVKFVDPNDPQNRLELQLDNVKMLQDRHA